MIPSLSEMIDLPLAAPAEEIDCAIEERFKSVLARASLGDANAQRELVALRIAYLNWAYASQQLGARRT
jgi:hypothetical protein